MMEEETEPSSRSYRDGRPERPAGETAVERANRRICALFDACREADTPLGTRDAALLSVLYGANVSRERALRLSIDAYDPTTGRLETPGEDPPVRTATEGAREALGDWVELRGDAGGSLFCRLRDDETAPGRPMETGDVDRLLDRWAGEAGVDDVRPEAFRRLYRSPWWTAGSPG